MTVLGGDPSCPIARSLDVLGERWTLLVLREAFRGRSRFSEFLALGVPRDILTARLATLVDAGVLERRPYKAQGARTRDEYVLTDAGRDVAPVLGALGEWGHRHRPIDEPPLVRFVETDTGERASVRFVVGDRVLEQRDVVLAD